MMTLLETFRNTQSSAQRRALADQLREQIDHLPANEQSEARKELKQFILGEMNHAISQIESALPAPVNHA